MAELPSPARRMNAQRHAILQNALEIKGRTYAELAQIAGLAPESIAAWVKKLRALKPAPLHIEGYEADSRGRQIVTVFRWGTKQDAMRPGPRPGAVAQRMRNLRARRKEERVDR